MYITKKEHSEKVHICGCSGSCGDGDNGIEGAPKAALGGHYNMAAQHQMNNVTFLPIIFIAISRDSIFIIVKYLHPIKVHFTYHVASD
jgi:hypothetical protein